MDKRPNDFFDVERLFERFFGDTFFPTLYGGSNIKVDIKENETEYVLEAELPGVEKEEIYLDYHNDKFEIAVHRNEEINEERENYIRKERKTGSISRVFYMPNIKEEGIKAKYSNGILTVRLPKENKGIIRSRRIEIE